MFALCLKKIDITKQKITSQKTKYIVEVDYENKIIKQKITEAKIKIYCLGRL